MKKRLLSFLLVFSIILSLPLSLVKADNNDYIENYNVDGSMNIKVLDNNSNPVSGAEFYISSEANGYLTYIIDDSEYKFTINGYYNSVMSNDNGEIVVGGLEPGNYTIEYANNLQGYGDHEDLRAVVGNEEETLNFTLSKLGGDRSNNSPGYINTVKQGHLSLKLTGPDGEGLSGVLFKIVDNSGAQVRFSGSSGRYEYSTNGVSEAVTSSDGSLNINYLPAGTYVISQSSRAKGYGDKMYSSSFNISDGSTTSLTASNEKVYGEIEIKIQDSIENKPLNGSKFKLVDTQSRDMKFSGSSGSYSFSRGEGIVEVESKDGVLKLSSVPVGTYKLIEVKTPEGYDKGSDLTLAVEENQTTKLNIVNKLSVGSIDIKVIDEISKNPVKGYGFKLYDSNGKELFVKKESDGIYKFSRDESQDLLISNEKGSILLSEIPVGDYFVKQEEAGEGYIVQEDKLPQKVEANSISKLEVSVFKSNASVNVSDSSGAPIRDILVKIIDKDGKVILEEKTNENGKVLIAGVSEGEYLFSLGKIKSPFMNKKYEGSFKITDKGDLVGLEDQIILYNSVSIEAISDNGDPIEGAVFRLKEILSDQEFEAVTDETGKAVFSELEDGNYELIQSEAPSKYSVDSDFMEEFTVDRDTVDEIKFSIENKSLAGGITEEENTTEEKKKESPLGLIFLGSLILIIVCWFIYSKYFSEENEKKDLKPNDKKNKDVKKDSNKKDSAPKDKNTNKNKNSGRNNRSENKTNSKSKKSSSLKEDKKLSDGEEIKETIPGPDKEALPEEEGLGPVDMEEYNPYEEDKDTGEAKKEDETKAASNKKNPSKASNKNKRRKR